MTSPTSLVEQFESSIDRIANSLHGKTLKFYPSIVGSIIFILVSLTIFWWMPSQIKIQPGAITARTFPSLMAGIMLACSIAVLLREVIKIIRKQPLDVSELNLLTETKALIILGLFVVFAVLAELIGFIPSSVIYSILMLVYFRIKKWSYYLIVSLSAIVIGLIFQKLLNVTLP
jgi:putative tricarboxylic transport membrane protein